MAVEVDHEGGEKEDESTPLADALTRLREARRVIFGFRYQALPSLGAD